MNRLYVVRGHVFYDTGSGTSIYAGPETPRDQARKSNAVRLRWGQIVDLMLDGMRETGGGRVVPENHSAPSAHI